METQETQKQDNSNYCKEEAKKINDEGIIYFNIYVNAHYKKKELDMAIEKYDQVIVTEKWSPNWH